MLRFVIIVSIFLLSNFASANPYFDSSKVPQDSAYGVMPKMQISRALAPPRGIEVLRISVKVDKAENYSIATLAKENSGTEAFIKRATHITELGSYRAHLRTPSGQLVGIDTIGTGKEFRKLVDAITFRFPSKSGDLIFDLEAENPVTGKMEKVLESHFNADQIRSIVSTSPVEVREISSGSTKPAQITLNIYAEGYAEFKKEQFFLDAQKAVAALVMNNFPKADQMKFFAVFAPSKQTLGNPSSLGLPVKEHDSFLGLYFPYWDNFGRWTDVVYPTREEKFRQALATVSYDYALVLADDSQYWGVGNFRELTAVPAHHPSFIYLLLHEIGHYFGLNEEYDSYGRTELEFAPQTYEPWSQNITFLRSKDHAALKWNKFVSLQTLLPTSLSAWQDGSPKYGAYPGGYAESPTTAHSHKPGLSCVMDRAENFCDICKEAIEKVINFDSGLTN